MRKYKFKWVLLINFTTEQSDPYVAVLSFAEATKLCQVGALLMMA